MCAALIAVRVAVHGERRVATSQEWTDPFRSSGRCGGIAPSQNELFSDIGGGVPRSSRTRRRLWLISDFKRRPRFQARVILEVGAAVAA